MSSNWNPDESVPERHSIESLRIPAKMAALSRASRRLASLFHGLPMHEVGDTVQRWI